MTPLFSIVVPTLNQAAFLEQTLASIVGQNWPRLELIVIDGGSTDGTREIVERYPVTHFISEPDGGQADAINKGFRLATGDLHAWLNSDDYYLPLTLARIAQAFGESREPQIVYGNCLLWFEKEGRARVARPEPFTPEALQTTSLLYQPSAFWTRALWEKTGELNPAYHFVLDWDFWLRAAKVGRFTYMDETLSVYRFHAGHKTSSGDAGRTQEILELVGRSAEPKWGAVFRDVAARLPSLQGRFRKARHPGLYLRHGEHAVAVALSQLHVAPCLSES